MYARQNNTRKAIYVKPDAIQLGSVYEQYDAIDTVNRKGISITDDKIRLFGFNNNTAGDSVLTTDVNGKLKFTTKPVFDWGGIFTNPKKVAFKNSFNPYQGEIQFGDSYFNISATDTTDGKYSRLYLDPRGSFELTASSNESIAAFSAVPDQLAFSVTDNQDNTNNGFTITKDNVQFFRLQNNESGDSVLTTDMNGNLKFKALSLNKFPTLKNNLLGDSILTTDTSGTLKLVAKPSGFDWNNTFSGAHVVNFKNSSSAMKGKINWDATITVETADSSRNGSYQNLNLDPNSRSFTLNSTDNNNGAVITGWAGDDAMLYLVAGKGMQSNSMYIRPNGIQLFNYRNNNAGDSVLTTDQNGYLKFKYISAPQAPQQQDSTWASDGINAYNKNSGYIGIGTQTPTAKLHTLGSVRFESFKNNPQNDSVLTTDQNGNLRFVYMPYGSGGGGGGTSYSFQNGITQFNGNVSLGGQLQSEVKINQSGFPFGIYNGPDKIFNLSAAGNVGIGTGPDAIYRMVVNGDVNVGLQFDTVGRSSKLFFGGYGNTDPFYMQRYNVRSDVSELRVNIGDDGFTGDRFHVGYVGAGTTTWNSSFVVETTGKAGIGTDDLTGQLSIGKDHGVKLAVGNSQWPQSAIIRTGYDNTNGDYTDVLVPGAATNSSMIRLNQAGNVGIGTLAPDAQYKLSVNGRIRAKGLRVQSANWSDFVFEPDYKLLSLPELEKFIKANKHLPQIPTTQDVMKDGQEVGEIQSKLLQKIEELTLYTIELNKQVKTLEEKNKKLEDQQKQIDGLQQQLEALKKLISK
jgi:uncharacterized coiled-coil protein SlyX